MEQRFTSLVCSVAFSAPMPLIAAANEEAQLRHAASLNKAGYQEEAHHEFRRTVQALNHAWFHEQGGSAVPKVARPGAGPDGTCGGCAPTRQIGRRENNTSIFAFQCFQENAPCAER